MTGQVTPLGWTGTSGPEWPLSGCLKTVVAAEAGIKKRWRDELDSFMGDWPEKAKASERINGGGLFLAVGQNRLIKKSFQEFFCTIL